jgi:uncharacterized membrane protein
LQLYTIGISPEKLSSSFAVYPHHRGAFLTFLIILLAIVVAFLFVGIAQSAFAKIGFDEAEFALILIATFLGSFINVPIYKLNRLARVVDYQEVTVFWVTYRVPQYDLRKVSTTVALNVGGALVPVLVSGYLLATHPSVLLSAVAGIVLTSVIVHLVARKVKGVGIVTPVFVPPLAAAIIAIIVTLANPSAAAVVAYVSGTLGALIGADLSNMRGLGGLGADMVSIGGAGTFDGVFLTGLIAVFLVTLI